MIDTETTAQIWAERYDRPILDTFAVQDEIAGAHMALGQMLVFSGNQDTARQVLRTAMRLNPVHPTIRLAEMLIGASLYLNREYAAAATHLRDVVLRFPRYSAANRWLIAALGQCGETEEARRRLDGITGRRIRVSRSLDTARRYPSDRRG